MPDVREARWATSTVQCDAPDGSTGCFLWEGATNDLNHKFVGPKDARKLASPVFGDSGLLFDWCHERGLPCEAGLMGRYRLN